MVATNIAETSVTIPGVAFVIDSGLVKKKIHQFGKSDRLAILPISKVFFSFHMKKMDKKANLNFHRRQLYNELDEQVEHKMVNVFICIQKIILLI